ncbi:MAG TPA: hypothetical protein DD719_04330 [Desulfotomaculum sp.]|nr:hypothetical protein [Desulfotomaculum sp.]
MPRFFFFKATCLSIDRFLFQKRKERVKIRQINKVWVIGCLFFLITLLTSGASKTMANNVNATSGPADFQDDFIDFDTNRWLKSSHNLGRSYLDPDNLSVSDGFLKIKIPATTLNGGEIESQEFYKYGSYRVRMKLPYAPSSITAFFLYRQPDYFNEIDIEIYNDDSRKIDFVVYSGGKRTHAVTKTLSFDPTGDFHEYRFDFDRKGLKFYVDNQLYQNWRNGLPTDSMKLLASTWFPTWLPGTSPEVDQYTLVDWIQVINKNR